MSLSSIRLRTAARPCPRRHLLSTFCALTLALSFASGRASAYQGMPTPPLHVDGRSLEDPRGKAVTLHGYMQPGASWFNGEGHNFRQPTDYTNPADVAVALAWYDHVADLLSHRAPFRPKPWVVLQLRALHRRRQRAGELRAWMG